MGGGVVIPLEIRGQLMAPSITWKQTFFLFFSFFGSVIRPDGTFQDLLPMSEFNEFKPRLKSPKNRFQLSADLNQNLNKILTGTNHIWAAAQIL